MFVYLPPPCHSEIGMEWRVLAKEHISKNCKTAKKKNSPRVEQYFWLKLLFFLGGGILCVVFVPSPAFLGGLWSDDDDDDDPSPFTPSTPPPPLPPPPPPGV